MNKLMKSVHGFAARQAYKMKMAMSNNGGEGYIDTAGASVRA